MTAAGRAPADRLVDIEHRLRMLPLTAHERIAPKQAAVLVALHESREVPHVWLTLRSSKLRAHGGEVSGGGQGSGAPPLHVHVCFGSPNALRRPQVSLPGGKRDPEDADDASTALREGHEEIALPPEAAQVIMAVCSGGRGPALAPALAPAPATPLCPTHHKERCWPLPPPAPQVLCCLPPLLSKHLLSVVPVVATVPNDFLPVPSPDEVRAPASWVA